MKNTRSRILKVRVWVSVSARRLWSKWVELYESKAKLEKDQVLFCH